MADDVHRDNHHDPESEREPDDGPELSRTYREAFASIGKAVSLAADWDTKRIAFVNGLREALTLWHGIDRQDIIDVCSAIAEAKGLNEHFGIDDIQITIAGQVEIAEAREQKAPNGNGQYYHGPDEDEHDERLRVQHAKDKAHEPKPPELIPLVCPFPIDEKLIPPREWVIPGFMMRRQITVLVAPSGSGKSLLTLQVGLACTLKEAWAGWRPRGELKVLFVNSEDDVMEMTRRLAAAVMTMGFKDRETEIGPRFMIADDPNGVILAKFDVRTKTLVRTPHLERLVKTIIENKIDIVFVDPFAETFEGDENSNSELKWAGILWREVARRTNAAICLVHHTKKYASGMAGDVDAARGASALIGIARLVATLFPMTGAEAQLMGITDEHKPSYLRYDDAKANLNLKSPFARWFKKVTRTLDNATDGIPADDVGALEPWSPPGAFEGITDADITEFWRKLDVGIVDSKGKVTGEFYCLSTRKASEHELSRYVGDLVMKHFSIKESKRASDIVKRWNEAKQFQETTYISPRQRKSRLCVHSLDWKPPDEPTPDNVLKFDPRDKPPFD